MIKKDTCNVFWTGGFDSTYRLGEILCRGSRTVRPVYIIDRDRKSLPFELKAMSKIRPLLTGRFDCRERFLPTAIYLKDEFLPGEEICSAYKKIMESAHIGSQSMWMAEFCSSMEHEYGRFEVCNHRHEPPIKWPQTVFDNPHDRRARKLKSGPGYLLFRHCSFRVLHLLKSEMKENAEKMNFSDILEHTWFCHRPVGGLPCEACYRCEVAKKQRGNLGFAFLGRERRMLSVIYDRLMRDAGKLFS